MKHIYQFGQLIIAYLLFTGCSSKEMFHFSKSTGSFGPYQKVQKAANLPDSVAILPEPSEPEQNLNDSPVLTASAIHLEPAPLPKQKKAGFNSGLPAMKMHSYRQVVKNRIRRNFGIEKQLIEPENNKQVHEAALVGFILSLASFGILLAGSPLAILASLAGAILSIIGLRKIKKNPGKYSGKGLAWAGVILGLLIPLFIVGYILAFAGAI